MTMSAEDLNRVFTEMRFRLNMRVHVVAKGDLVQVGVELTDTETGALLASAQDSDRVIIYKDDLR